MDLAAVYQCRNQYEATSEVLTRFRHHYPSVPVLMINDGGDVIMKCISDMYHTEYAPCSKTSCDELEFIFSDPHSAIQYVERILSGIPGDDCFVLLLEDDVWIRAQVPLTDLHYDFSGGHAGLYLSKDLADVVKAGRKGFERTKHILFAYSGGGFLKSSFMNTVRDSSKWKQYVDALFLVQSRISSGELLSCLVLMAGGTVGPYAGYYEPWFLTYKIKKKIGWDGGVRILGKEKSLIKKI